MLPAGITPPIAVRTLETADRVVDLVLPNSHHGRPYSALLLIVLDHGEPLGSEMVPVLDQRVSATQIDELLSANGWLNRDGLPEDSASLSRQQLVFSVVVTTMKASASLERCIRSILASARPGTEILVIDNRPQVGSARPLVEALAAGDSRVSYHEEPRQGLSNARNKGLALAHGDVVVFTDDDITVAEGWLERMERAIDRGADAVTGLILPSELETQEQIRLEQFAGFGKGFEARRFTKVAPPEDMPLFPYTPGQVGSGANTAVRTAVLRALGGFDPVLGAGTLARGGEDLDLYIRLLHAGHTIAYEPSAIVWHQHPDGRSLLTRQAFSYGVGLSAMLTKQLFRGQGRLRLLRAVPRGFVYYVSPRSYKNARKNRDYPRVLDLVEALGVMVGPSAYLRSRIKSRRHRDIAGD